MWNPGSIKYMSWGRRVPGMAFGCLSAVQVFVWHSLPPVFPFMSPPYRVVVVGRGGGGVFGCWTFLFWLCLSWSEILLALDMSRAVRSRRQITPPLLSH